MTTDDKHISSQSTEEDVNNRVKKGKDFADSGLVEESITIFEEILSVFPEKANVLTEYAKAMREVKDYNRSEELFKESLGIDPNNVKTIFSYAQTLVRIQKYDSAFLLFDRALEIEPDELKLLSAYASAASKATLYFKANELFEKAMLIDGDNVPTLNSYAITLAKQEQYEKAHGLFERSLQLEGDNVTTLNSYSTTLVQQGKYEKANGLFERSLQIGGDNVTTLSKHANTLVQQGEYEKANGLFERSLQIGGDKVTTLNNYATTLAKQGKYEKANGLFERSLQLKGDNVTTLSRYANTLVQQGEYEKANGLFERSLQLDESHIITISSYANTLVQQGEYEKANGLFERSLQLEGDNVTTLSRYANTLVQQGEYEKANGLFERSLQLEGDNVTTLSRYANTLVQQGEYEKANGLFERSLQLDESHIITINSYANTLVQQGEYEKANDLFERSLQLEESNIITLSRYANTLVQQEKYEKAIMLSKRYLQLGGNDTRTLNTFTSALVYSGEYEKAILLQPSNSYARLQYAKQLESQGKYSEAVIQLLAINLATQANYHANIIRLHLGRLYHFLHQPETGTQYFDDAIAYSEDKDKSRLYAARSFLASNPYSEDAIDLLRQIEASSPLYDEAMKAIALNADSQTSFELFAGGKETVGNAEMLYRAMYHKIGNEVAILKSIALRLLRKIEDEHPIVSEIVRDLGELQQSVNRQKDAQKAAIADIPRDNYQQLIEIVSKTAHDISDEVNNILATIESKTRRFLRKLANDSPLQENFKKLLAQLGLTQTALNDLKSINEGMTIRRSRFPVRKLFEKWEPANWGNKPRIQKARVTLNLENPDAEFDGDEEKIKSIINELVENSLKHNEKHRDLSIWIVAQDLVNPHDIAMPTIPGDRKHLYIQLSDNGNGISADKKEWIFQPLNTTSPEEKGSGLGLFIARKTLEKMGGYIREVGESGKSAKFQIYIPYPTSNEV
jgi:tetratricopeptide (TPR) repeat protein/anti-sigma regulatory factor (Ser/Thr protein kinase)